jgi:hypothetical protein
MKYATLVVVVSCCVGLILDLSGVASPPLFWGLGYFTGVVVVILKANSSVN